LTTDMLSWTRQQIETRKALAEAASGESWTARRVMDVGYMVADEDGGNAVARLWVEMSDLVDGFHSVGVNPLDTSKHIAFNDPRQLIADCEADLAILDDHDGSHECASVEDNCMWILDGDCPTVRRIASRYRHRAGYLPEWAPEGAAT